MTEGQEVQRQTQIWIQLKGRAQGLTLLLMLWFAYKQEPNMTALQKQLNASEEDVSTQPMDRR